MKDWKTSVTALVGGIIMIIGILRPEMFNQDVQEALTVSSGQIIAGIGGLIAVIGGLWAKDRK